MIKQTGERKDDDLEVPYLEAILLALPIWQDSWNRIPQQIEVKINNKKVVRLEEYLWSSCGTTFRLAELVELLRIEFED